VLKVVYEMNAVACNEGDEWGDERGNLRSNLGILKHHFKHKGAAFYNRGYGS
jgi:hypothetical protein